MISKIIEISHLCRAAHRVVSWGCLPALILAACFDPCYAQGQTASASPAHVFTLKYTEEGRYLSINPGKEEVKFRKEPDFGNDRVLRRALVFGPGTDDFIGFAINVSRRTLYLDLNRNLNLTDDPQGIYKGTGATRATYFRDVRLNLREDGVDRSYSLFMNLLGQNLYSVIVTSCYQGNIELQGRKWKVTVSDNLDAEIDRRDRFVIGPADGGSGALYADSMPVPKKLLLGGVHYRVDFAYGSPANGFSSMCVSFEEISSPAGELILDGRFIRRLVLEGEQGAAVLDSPPQSIHVPADGYRVLALYLQSEPVKPRLSTDASQIPRFAVVTGAPFHLKIGGPLESGVVVRARGNVLQLDYILKGVGGERYSVSNTTSQAAPTFAIYRGGRKLAGGVFRYG
jgi:hypothetical protein